MFMRLSNKIALYLRLNKKKLRAKLYQGLQDAIAASDNSTDAIEQRIILPSSFTVGPRHMVQIYQDAMAIYRWAGCLDAFCYIHLQSLMA